MGQSAKAARQNRIITIDFQDQSTYFQLISNGKAFVEFVLACILSIWLGQLRTSSRARPRTTAPSSPLMHSLGTSLLAIHWLHLTTGDCDAFSPEGSHVCHAKESVRESFLVTNILPRGLESIRRIWLIFRSSGPSRSTGLL